MCETNTVILKEENMWETYTVILKRNICVKHTLSY
jgi:hypothetical protein